MLIPTNYEQFVEIRRQAEARRQEERSPAYEKMLADTMASVSEWRDWRIKHPAPGTMLQLKATAEWLTPLAIAAQLAWNLVHLLH